MRLPCRLYLRHEAISFIEIDTWPPNSANLKPEDCGALQVRIYRGRQFVTINQLWQGKPVRNSARCCRNYLIAVLPNGDDVYGTHCKHLLLTLIFSSKHCVSFAYCSLCMFELNHFCSGSFRTLYLLFSVLSSLQLVLSPFPSSLPSRSFDPNLSLKPVEVWGNAQRCKRCKREREFIFSIT